MVDTTNKGTLYGVSVGPGDPELMTLQAVRCLRACPVIAAPQTASGQMLALEIARGGRGFVRQDGGGAALSYDAG